VGNPSGRRATYDDLLGVPENQLGEIIDGQLIAQPWPGPLGKRIYEQVSAEAWAQWEERMKMILNEYRLMPWQKDAQDLMARYMEEFFFGTVAAAPPPGYVPQPK